MAGGYGDPTSLPPAAASWLFNPKAQIKSVCKIVSERVNHDMPRSLNYIMAERFSESLDNYIFGFTAGAIKKILQMVSREVHPTSQSAADVQMTGDVGFPDEVSISAAGYGFLCTICEDLSRAIMGALEQPFLDTCLVYIDEAFSVIVCEVVGEYYPRHEAEQVYEALAADCYWEDSLCTAFSYAVADNVQKAYFDIISDALDEAMFAVSSSFHGLLPPGVVGDVLARRIRRSLAEAIGALADGTIRASQGAARKALANGISCGLYGTLGLEFNDSLSNAEGLVAWCGEKMEVLSLFHSGDEGNGKDVEMCGEEDEDMGEYYEDYDF